MTYTQDKYDVYELDVATSEKTSQYLFKLLFANQNFSSANDYIVFCTASDIKELTKQGRFKFRNFSVSNGGDVWLTVCQPPCNTLTSSRECIAIKKEFHIWEFLWDLIFYNWDISVEGEPFTQAIDIHFPMSENYITLYNPQTKSEKCIWTVPDIHSSKNVVPVQIKCSTDFYEKWKNFIGRSGISKQITENTVLWEIRLWELFYSYNSAYALCRFTEQELAYLADKYLLTKTYLEGVRLGNWYMHALNNIPSELRLFQKQVDKRESGALCFSFDADLPDIVEFKTVLENDLEAVYDELIAKKTLENIIELFETKLKKKFNLYYQEFVIGLLAQISTDKHIINEHEYLIAESEQTKLTALSERMFIYRLLDNVLHLSSSSVLYLYSGRLKMEVCE